MENRYKGCLYIICYLCIYSLYKITICAACNEYILDAVQNCKQIKIVIKIKL